MLESLVEDRARAVDQLGYVLRRRWLKHELASAVVDEMGRTGSSPSGAGGPVAGENSIVEADQKLAVPPEGGVIGAAQDKAHRIVVPADERRVLFARLGGTVAGEDVWDPLDRDRDAFH